MTSTLQDGTLFLHIPKTGGMWVEKCLHTMGLVKEGARQEHADLAHYGTEHLLRENDAFYKRPPWRSRKVIRQRDRMPFVFCFVRHPLDWYESLWRFSRKRGWVRLGRSGYWSQWHPFSFLNEIMDEDFNRFMEKVVRRRPGLVTELFYGYARPEVNFVGKTENLAEDLITVLEYLQLPYDPEVVKRKGKVNVTSDSNVNERWDESLKAQVLELEKPAMVHFGYADLPGATPGTMLHPALQRIVPLEENR